MLRFTCPACTTVHEAPDSAAGSKLPCSHCGQRLQVPALPPARTVLAPLVAHQPDGAPSTPARTVPPPMPPMPPAPVPRRSASRSLWRLLSLPEVGVTLGVILYAMGVMVTRAELSRLSARFPAEAAALELLGQDTPTGHALKVAGLALAIVSAVAFVAIVALWAALQGSTGGE